MLEPYRIQILKRNQIYSKLNMFGMIMITHLRMYLDSLSMLLNNKKNRVERSAIMYEDVRTSVTERCVKLLYNFLNSS